MATFHRRRKRGNGDSRLVIVQSVVLTGLIVIMIVYVVGFWTIVKQQKTDKEMVSVAQTGRFHIGRYLHMKLIKLSFFTTFGEESEDFLWIHDVPRNHSLLL